jgi:hypothetical protein
MLVFIIERELAELMWTFPVIHSLQMAREKTLQLKYVVAECLNEGVLSWRGFLTDGLQDGDFVQRSELGRGRRFYEFPRGWACKLFLGYKIAHHAVELVIHFITALGTML